MLRIAAQAGNAPTAAALALGALLALCAPAAAQIAAPQTAAASGQSAVVTYGSSHIEAALNDALTQYVPVGRVLIELDNRGLELHAPSDWGSLAVQNVYFNNVNGRFAAELVVPGPTRALRVPVAGRAYGVVRAPVLIRRVAPGDIVTAADVDWVDVRADQMGSDVAADEKQLIGMTPRRGVPVQTPVRLRDMQSQRVVAKGALVTITYQTARISLTAQGRALEDGGVGDVVRVINTQSNRTVHTTVAGPNIVAAAKPGAALN